MARRCATAHPPASSWTTLGDEQNGGGGRPAYRPVSRRTARRYMAIRRRTSSSIWRHRFRYLPRVYTPLLRLWFAAPHRSGTAHCRTAYPHAAHHAPAQSALSLYHPTCVFGFRAHCACTCTRTAAHITHITAPHLYLALARISRQCWRGAHRSLPYLAASLTETGARQQLTGISQATSGVWWAYRLALGHRITNRRGRRTDDRRGRGRMAWRRKWCDNWTGGRAQRCISSGARLAGSTGGALAATIAGAGKAARIAYFGAWHKGGGIGCAAAYSAAERLRTGGVQRRSRFSSLSSKRSPRDSLSRLKHDAAEGASTRRALYLRFLTTANSSLVFCCCCHRDDKRAYAWRRSAADGDSWTAKNALGEYRT